MGELTTPDSRYRLSFTSGRGPRVRGDAVRLQQVISNLIRNAIAYTPAGGTISVDVQPDHGDATWVLTVTDTGIGIEPDDLTRVFEAFYRTANSHQASVKGTGLGLSIARLIVNEHGGTISVDSTPGEGTTMTVRLPFGAP